MSYTKEGDEQKWVKLFIQLISISVSHKNCLAYDNRPWGTTEENDAALIRNWNDAVGPDDEVYLLGDVSWHNVTKTIEYLNDLNGVKHLIIGNHDQHFLKNKQFRDCFVEIAPYKEIYTDDGKGIVLCHYPIPTYNHHYNGWVHFYGHVHNSFEWQMVEHFQQDMVALYEKPSHMYNVGCMMPYMHWTPQTAQAIEENWLDWKETMLDGV